MSFVKRFSEKTLEKENITKESTRRCPLPSPDQCAINDAADKVFGDAPYNGVCRQSRGLIFPDCLPENWLFKTHLTPSYRFVLNTRCYSCALLRGTSSRLSEASSLLELRHTLGNDSVLQCVLHQYLNGSHWHSVASSKRAGSASSLFRVSISGVR